MTFKLLTEQYLEFLSLKEAAQARLSLQTLHMSKCHIVGNHMSRLICIQRVNPIYDQTIKVMNFKLNKYFGYHKNGLLRIPPNSI